MPAFWPAHIGPMPFVRHIGMTVWETDRITPHWLPQLARMDHLCVPCEHNAAVLRAAGPKLPPVSVVPHVCRGELRPPPPARLVSLAKWLKIRPDDTVFYTINAWDPRKRLAELVEGFVRNFRAEDPVVLVVKSGRRALFDDPATPGVGRGVADMFAQLVGRVAAELGREPPRISLLADDDLADNVIDGLHTLGHCYVSLSRAEGFGLGGFDAATQGRPVIAVGYGGPLDYLGQDWPGRVPHRMVKCEALPGFTWFDPEQNWPEPDDAAAFDLMRQFVADRTSFMAHAAAAAARIRSQFDAATISRQLREMIDNVG